jgi:hypothetical protein
MSKQIDNLTEDAPIANQNFVCLSFVSPEGIPGCTIRTLKIRGVYKTYEEAQERAKELQEIDADFNVFIGEVGKWLPWDPNPHEGAKDQVYYEKEMQDLVSGYKDNLQKAKKEVNQRAADSRNSKTASIPIPTSNDRKEKQLAQLRHKLELLKSKKEVKEIQEDIGDVQSDIDADVSSYERYMEGTVSDKINKIKELQKQ